MRKISLVVALLVGCAAVAFSQAMPVLGILPFTGGTGDDGEAIATLVSMEPEIMGAFTVVPRTAALNAIFEEHYFQLAGLTDSDTIAGIGRMLNAEYVLSGNIRRLGDRNLVIATIVNVETFEQVAGYYRTYLTIEEVRDFLPSMAASMVASTLGRDTSGLPSLAMLPFARAAGVDAHDAETLSMILAIEIINAGSHVVLPRTSTIIAALEEQDFQMMGYTEDESMVALGRALNADLVLSGGVHRLGALNLFTAQVLRVADGSMVSGASRDYQVIADGIDLMPELALLLTDPDRAAAIVFAPVEPPRRPGFPRWSSPMLEDPARLWSVDVSGSFSAVDLASADVFAAGFTVHATLAPLRHSFVRVGCAFLFGTSVSHDYFSSVSVSPFVHGAFFMPLGDRGGWYVGAGGSFMTTSFETWNESGSRVFPAVDFAAGFRWGWLSVSYTLRTDFSAFSDIVSVGFSHRFRSRGDR